MTRRMIAVLVAVLLVGWAAPARSSTIAYDEAISGDLSATGSPLTTFTLDVGTNTVTGQESIQPSTDPDSFAFVVPAGMELVSVTLSLTGDTQNGATWRLYSGSANYGSGTLLLNSFGGSGGNTFSLGLVPLLDGTYNFSWSSIFCSGCSGIETIPYTFSLVVANPVPEPASLSLLALGLAGLGARRWRQRKA